MIATMTLKTIVMVLFGMTIIWLIKVLIKRESETLVRALLTAVFFGAILLLLQRTTLQTISWKNIKQIIFPEKSLAFGYVRDEGHTSEAKYIRYTFPAPTGQGDSMLGAGPRLNLTLDPTGKYYHITDIEQVNKILTYLGLPEVKTGAKELAAITGKLTDVNCYRWEDYDGRVLTIERGLCPNVNGLERYPCIVSITIKDKY